MAYILQPKCVDGVPWCQISCEQRRGSYCRVKDRAAGEVCTPWLQQGLPVEQKTSGLLVDSGLREHEEECKLEDMKQRSEEYTEAVASVEEATAKVTKLDSYERWALDKIDNLRARMEAEEVVGFAMVVLHPMGTKPPMTLHRMTKAGEAHRLIGALQELSWDICKQVYEGGEVEDE